MKLPLGCACDAERDQLREQIMDARNTGQEFFRKLGYLDDSWERTSAMGRAEEGVAFVERLLEKIK
jgi:hypothetical protein